MNVLKNIFFSFLTIIIGLFSNAQITFEKTYDGTDSDIGYSVQQIADGGYIIVGGTGSFGVGYNDVYLIKTNENGDTLWTKNYGGTSYDDGYSVQQTSDNGYIIAGVTNSFGAGYNDVYLIKTNESGDTLWTKTYGGTDHDRGFSVQQTLDGGYIIAGYTESFGAGIYDVYLIKTNANGDTIWTKTYGGIDSDIGRAVQQTSDNGYIIAGYTSSFGAGLTDVYLIKTNESGDTLWTKTYGGTDNDWGFSVQQTSDNGYIIVGKTSSFGAGSWDVYLIKTNENGDTLWTKTYGSTDNDYGYSVQQTTDNGYIIAGNTYSFGTGTGDVYLIKTNEEGDTLWTKTYGGTDNDGGNSVQQTSDGGYIIVGSTGNIFAGSADVYLIKTDVNGNVSGIFNNSFSKKDVINIYPNPNKGVFTIEIYDLQPSADGYDLRIYDILGCEIIKFTTTEHKYKIDVSELSKGVYYLRLKTENEIGVKKLIIQ